MFLLQSRTEVWLHSFTVKQQKYFELVTLFPGFGLQVFFLVKAYCLSASSLLQPQLGSKSSQYLKAFNEKSQSTLTTQECQVGFTQTFTGYAPVLIRLNGKISSCSWYLHLSGLL